MVSGLGAAADGYGELRPWARRQFGELIAHRRLSRRPTIVASRMQSWKEIRALLSLDSVVPALERNVSGSFPRPHTPGEAPPA